MGAAKLFNSLMMLVVVGTYCKMVSAGDPDMLQDICVADLRSTVIVNGFTCKLANNVIPDDFFTNILSNPGATNNTLGAVVTAANVQRIPGVNTLGVSLVRIDFAPGGLNPPHTHPRATEIIFVLAGEIDVAFITTANVHFSKHLRRGEVFVFPRGLAHYQINNGRVPASALSAFNSQLPGVLAIAPTLFASTPSVPDNVLARAFQITTAEVRTIRSRFAR